MNLEEQQPPLQLPLRFSTCDRHPDQTFTSFCASCLRERLSILETSAITSSSTTSTSRTATSALKAIFNRNKPPVAAAASSSSSYSVSTFLPELRRSKSFSGGKGEGFSGVLVPQRKSCDVRARSSLWALFNQDDVRKVETWGEIEVETRELGFSGVVEPVFEEDNDEEEVNEEEIKDPNVNFIQRVEEIVEVEEEIIQGEVEQVKPMKEHIELDAHNKKPPGRDLKEIAGNFWVAASVFSKKLQKWRSKQKTKKQKGGGDGSSVTMQVDKPYSEIADYGYGRRSIDIDPRYSLDAGRMSFDDPRYSWDAPRASWDGYLTGRTFPTRVPAPLVSLVEHVPVSVPRVDNQIPVEEPRISINEDPRTPGGSAQTRDYYSSDSSSSQRRRKSFERSNSIRKKAAAVVAELDDTKLVPNAKVSPATTLDPFSGAKLQGTDKDLRSLKSNSLRDDCSESFESTFRDAASVASAFEQKGSKKSRRWSKAWNIWGLIYRRSGNKDEEEERYGRGNMVQRSFSESWPELRREPNGDAKGALNRVLRSNSSVSSRNSFSMNGSLSSTRKSAAETNFHGKKKKEEPVLERNKSGRYSSNDIDNGLLRFYLTPMRSGRKSGSGKSVPKNSHSMTNSVLRMY
ncbi:Octopus-like protein [Thalictrum thalictroides]|uniref:Octopus-like protein n=1 Tax=Thalictrum thalictroides TaxID=46969 RepID=A0A7J6VYC3_THATH|nr:Octopus-like protein [Thalictrum thalictroides]